MKQGIIYGVGVGPGDPELLTLKTVRLIHDCDLAAIPQKKEKCFAYQIAAQAVPELREKPMLEIEMPMTRDRSLREKAWAEGAAALREPLDQGKAVVFLTLGDPSVYSTSDTCAACLRNRDTTSGWFRACLPSVPPRQPWESLCAKIRMNSILSQGARRTFLQF